MNYRTATTADLAAIFRDLALRMADQYATAGLNIDEVKDEFLMCLREGRGHTLLEDGRPVAMIAWREVDDAAQTAFAAHESFFPVYSSLLQETHQAYPGPLRKPSDPLLQLVRSAGSREVVPRFGVQRRGARARLHCVRTRPGMNALGWC
jgi:hypothetical protein